jgi:hypothetical protein
MQAMKRAAQARDRALLAAGEVPREAMLCIRPEMPRGAKVEWPEGSLLDEEAQPHQSERPPGKT